MKSVKIIFVRHGQTDQNLDIAAGREVKEYDYPLNEEGIKQAQSTRDKLGQEPIDAIVSSPMLRAKMTAEIINELHNTPINYKEDLRERSVGGVPMDVWHELFDMDKNIQPSGDNTEDVRSFFKRVYGAIDEIIEENAGKTIAVVAHGGVHHAFHAYVNRLPLKGNMRIDTMNNADIRFYEIKLDGGEK